MKIPDKIKIGGHWYVVKCPHNFTERGDLEGQQDGDALEIRIAGTDSWSGRGRPESVVAATFLHEILHACDFKSGHAVFRDNEKAIEGIAEMLFQVLRDNKLRFDEVE